MIKNEKKLLSIILIYIILMSAFLAYLMNKPPKYDQKLCDEIYNKYEEQKEEDYANFYENNFIENNSIEKNTVKKKNNPTYMNIDVQGNKVKIIGKIIIKKINLNYPIISESTDENLKIAPTKLCGPLINTTGNLCIVGHNYVNNKLFSNLGRLQKNDEVILVDNNDNQLNYKVYDKKIVPHDDTACISQNTNNSTEVTLITCTNKNNERLVVKCRSV